MGRECRKQKGKWRVGDGKGREKGKGGGEGLGRKPPFMNPRYAPVLFYLNSVVQTICHNTVRICAECGAADALAPSKCVIRMTAGEMH